MPSFRPAVAALALRGSPSADSASVEAAAESRARRSIIYPGQAVGASILKRVVASKDDAYARYCGCVTCATRRGTISRACASVSTSPTRKKPLTRIHLLQRIRHRHIIENERAVLPGCHGVDFDCGKLEQMPRRAVTSGPAASPSNMNLRSAIRSFVCRSWAYE